MSTRKSYEAMARCMGGYSVEHAKALRLSTSLMNKWSEPSTDFTDSGALNPLDRIETVMKTAVETGKADDDAFAPLHYLARKMGFVAVPVDPGTVTYEDHVALLALAMGEMGDYTSKHGEALADGKVTLGESRVILREGYEAACAIITAITAVEQAGEVD